MLNRKGQNTAEYAILIALVVGAAVAMQTYVKRGLQGRVADATDFAPVNCSMDGDTLGFDTRQYEPYYANSIGVINSERTLSEGWENRGGVDREELVENTVRETGAWDEQTTFDGYDR